MKDSRVRALLVAAALCGGCDDRSAPTAGSALDASAQSTDADAIADARFAAAAWPAFPKNEGEARRLIDTSFVRAAPSIDAGAAMPIGADAGAVRVDAGSSANARIGVIVDAVARGEAIAGWPSIAAFFAAWQKRAAAAGKNAWMLLGTHHDSAAQVRAFGALVGSGASGDDAHPVFARVALEQLHADGRWNGVAADAQRGDDAALLRLASTPNDDAYRTLFAAQEKDDYAAWKYGYVPDVLAVLTGAHARGESIVGCDMPGPLRALVPADLSEETVLRLRELHCTRALADSLAGVAPPYAVAMLWGDEHVQPTGFPRLVAPADEVLAVHVFGARASATEPDASLARRVVAADPFLVVHGGDAFLVLPDDSPSTHVDRVREARSAEPRKSAPGVSGRSPDDEAQGGATAIELTASHPMRARVGAHEVKLDRDMVPVPAFAGAGGGAAHVTLAIDLGPRTVVVVVDVADGSRVEVHVEDAAPELRIVVHTRAKTP